MRWVRVVGVPTAMVVGAGALLGAPSDAAVTAPCTMRVTIDRVSSVTYGNGVERNKYTVKLSWGDRSQTAEVHRMVMPAKARPRLVTMKLGTLRSLRTQLESPKGNRGISAVNGDFFYSYRIDGKPFDGEVGVSGTVTHAQKVLQVDSLNWQLIGAEDVAIYTPAWADVQRANRPAGVVEWVVRQNKIIDVRTGTRAGKPLPPA